MPRNRLCGSYGPGHLLHWIQGKKSHEDGQSIIKVKVVAVHDDGHVEEYKGVPDSPATLAANGMPSTPATQK